MSASVDQGRHNVKPNVSCPDVTPTAFLSHQRLLPQPHRYLPAIQG
jgi:hypothetical protein